LVDYWCVIWDFEIATHFLYVGWDIPRVIKDDNYVWIERVDQARQSTYAEAITATLERVKTRVDVIGVVVRISHIVETKD
jgi:hypothetical protein